MTFINVGAYVDGERPKTKAALKRALAERIESVDFDTTGVTETFCRISAVQLRDMESAKDFELSVTGPDPYRARNFYATVSLSQRTGKVVLK